MSGDQTEQVPVPIGIAGIDTLWRMRRDLGEFRSFFQGLSCDSEKSKVKSGEKHEFLAQPPSSMEAKAPFSLLVFSVPSRP